MFRLTSLVLLLSSGLWAQYVQTAYSHPTAAGATPGFVNETSKNSTLTHALGTNPSGQTACANNSYCLPYVDLALSGNLGIIPFQYANATVVTATIADDKSDTGKACFTGSQDATSTKWNGLCYIWNLTAGAHYNTIGLASGVTQATAKAAQFSNIQNSSDPIDAHASCAGASGTTANCGSVTTTVANDLIYVYVCAVNVSPMTSFTAGTGFTLLTTDIEDGCASEYQVDAGTGSITPTMTLSPASRYIEFVAAFKSATAGTAPSGWYAEKMMSWSSTTSAASYTFQFPSAGNMLYMQDACGSTLVPTSITDSVNTWTSSGANNGNVNEFFVKGATSNSTGLLTVNNTGTGDCTYMFYSFKGAPTSPPVGRATYTDSSPTATNLITFRNNTGSTGVITWLPAPSSGVAFAQASQGTDTSTTMVSPSGCISDTASFGGEALSGPSPIDENNPFGHCNMSSGSQPLFVFNESSTIGPGSFTADGVGFISGVGIVNAAFNTGSGTTLAITVPSTTSGNLLAVAIDNFLSTGNKTVSKVCLDGTTCAAGNAFTQFTGAVSTGTGHAATDIWYLLNAPAGKTTVTITFSATGAATEAEYIEAARGSGSWATDGANHVSNGTGSGTTLNGPSVTTTGTSGICLAIAAPSGSITTNPLAGNEFVYANIIFSGSTDAASGLVSSTAAAHQPKWTDGGASDSFSASTGCWK